MSLAFCHAFFLSSLLGQLGQMMSAPRIPAETPALRKTDRGGGVVSRDNQADVWVGILRRFADGADARLSLLIGYPAQAQQRKRSRT